MPAGMILVASVATVRPFLETLPNKDPNLSSLSLCLFSLTTFHSLAYVFAAFTITQSVLTMPSLAICMIYSFHPRIYFTFKGKLS